MNAINRFFISTSVFIAVLISISCTHDSAPSTSGRGGVDGGGAIFVFLNRDEVINQTNLAWESLTRSRIDNPLIVAFIQMVLRHEPSNSPSFVIIKKILSLTPDEYDRLGKATSIPGQKLGPLTSLEKLRTKSIHFQEASTCVGPWHPSSAASVSKLNMTGEVCASIPELKKTPKASGDRDILALMVHEIAHLNGFQEDDAVLIQNYFLNNIDTVLMKSGENIKWRLFSSLDSLTERWPTYIEYNQFPPGYSEFVADWVASLNIIYLDTPGPFTDDDVNIAQPDLYNDYFRDLLLAQEYCTDFLNQVSDKSVSGASSHLVTPKLLADMQSCIVGTLTAEKTGLEFYFDKNISPYNISELAEKIETKLQQAKRATSPEHLGLPGF